MCYIVKHLQCSKGTSSSVYPNKNPRQLAVSNDPGLPPQVPSCSNRISLAFWT